MSQKVTIQVNLSTIESEKAELLMLEARDYLEAKEKDVTNKSKDQKRK